MLIINLDENHIMALEPYIADADLSVGRPDFCATSIKFMLILDSLIESAATL